MGEQNAAYLEKINRAATAIEAACGGAEIAEKLRAAQAEFMRVITEGIPQSELDCFMAVNEAMCKNAERIGE